MAWHHVTPLLTTGAPGVVETYLRVLTCRVMNAEGNPALEPDS